MISDEKARESVYEFLVNIDRDGGFEFDRVKELLGSAVEDESPNVGPRFAFKSQLGNFSVSQRTGDVVSYSVPETGEMGLPTVSQDQATEIAMRFISKVHSTFDQALFQITEKDEAHGHYKYNLEQVKKAEETSIFPNFILVSVRADNGMISYYACSNLVFSRSTKPRITEAEARVIVKKEIGPNGQIDKLELMEQPVDKATRSITVWFAAVTFLGPESSSNAILIDAETGETIVEDE